MQRSIRLLPLFAGLLTLTGCDPILTSFTVPATAWAGHEFVVAIAGNAGSTQTGGKAGCVLQLPPGFALAAFGPGTRNDPTLLSLYTPEPGHTLASLSGYTNAIDVATHFVVRAPSSLGSFSLKVSLAGAALGFPFHASSPAGITNFAQITVPTHGKVVVVQSAPTGAFALERPAWLGSNTTKALLVDIDGDGRDDFVSGRGPRVLLNRGGGTWLDVSPANTGSSLDAIAAGDFDGDGFIDLVHGTRTIYFGNGQGGWTLSSLQPPTNSSVFALGAGDFDGDGRDDIVESDASGWMRCFQSRPNRTFASRSYGLPATGYVQLDLVFADVDGDGFVDIVGSGGIWRGSGTGTWTGVVGFYNGRVAVGDVTGDGRPDLVAQTTWGPTTYSYNGVGWVGAPIAGLPTNNTGSDLELLDFDGDGWLDLLLGGNGVQLWRNLGNSTFALETNSGLPAVLAVSVPSGLSVGSFAVGDSNGDGWADLLVTSGAPGDWDPLLFSNLTTGVAPFGSSCQAIGLPTPDVIGLGQPTVGNTNFAVGLQHGLANGFALVWLGTSKRYYQGQPVLPLSLAPFGAPACSVLAEPLVWQFLVLDASGSGSMPMPIPNDPTLQRVSFFAQGAAFVPGANALGLLTTNGLLIRIQ